MQGLSKTSWTAKKQSKKLAQGGADKLDVWSIFTLVLLPAWWWSLNADLGDVLSPANMPPDAINLGQGFMSESDLV
jgi:hypothetical protein